VEKTFLVHSKPKIPQSVVATHTHTCTHSHAHTYTHMHTLTGRATDENFCTVLYSLMIIAEDAQFVITRNFVSEDCACSKHLHPQPNTTVQDQDTSYVKWIPYEGFTVFLTFDFIE